MDASSPIKRLAAGDRELARPSSGLSLAQRRLLTQLGTPASLAELAARGNLEPRKLERDLARLTEIGLVDAGGAALPPPEMQSRSPANESFGAPRRGVGIAVAAAVVGLAATAWLGWPTLSGAPPADLRGPSSPALIASTPTQPKTPISAVTAAVTAAMTTPPPVPASATPAIVAASPDTASVVDQTDAARTRGSKTASSHAAPGIANTRATASGAKHEPGIRAASRESPSHSPQREVLPTHLAATHIDLHPASPNPLAVPAATGARAVALPPPTAPAAAPAQAPVTAERSPAAAEPAPDRLPTQIAMAAPPAAATTPPAPSTFAPPKLVPLVREDPQFPREALRREIDRGRVTARLSIDAAGKVTGVAILQASPRGVFEGAVRAALVRWQFPPGAAGRSTDVDVAFNRD